VHADDIRKGKPWAMTMEPYELSWEQLAEMGAAAAALRLEMTVSGESFHCPGRTS
jgi:hypothetical protein